MKDAELRFAKKRNASAANDQPHGGELKKMIEKEAGIDPQRGRE
jgi:hypothetical protein